ncbi:hypothetical protein F5Y03DRAFT_239281 [Xylaria venustula]|nr:hypothetical protein F5Y03DRAFT_239281 [Xylaria venustula]
MVNTAETPEPRPAPEPAPEPEVEAGTGLKPEPPHKPQPAPGRESPSGVEQDAETEADDNLSKRLGRIGIWRDEVTASPQHCMCSAPTIPPKGGRPQSREDRDTCPVCGLPVGGVKYKSLSRMSLARRILLSRTLGSNECGLVWPQPLSSNESPSEQEEKIKGKAMAVLSKISRTFQRDKGPNSQLPLIELVDSPKTPAATEMYSRLRPEAPGPRDSADNEDGHGETSSAVSDEDRKKLKTSLAVSVERLRRAQELLDKGGHSS